MNILLVFVVVSRFLNPQGFVNMQLIKIKLHVDICGFITHPSTVSDF